MKRGGLPTLAVGAFLATQGQAQGAYCPSYTPALTSGSGGARCAVAPADGTNPDLVTWTSIFDVVGDGPSGWGPAGPSTTAGLPVGCGKPTSRRVVSPHFPCPVLQAIAMQESGWRQFCVPTTPAAVVGTGSRTLVTFDCGYGVGQVTSGMRVGEAPSFDRSRVAADPLYNLATGALLLRDKWAVTPCVGDRNPDLVEDWYGALWAYNGLSYANNPNNPNLKAGRGVYDPTVGGAFAYQERVLGWMEHPPSPVHWVAVAAAYPDRGDLAAGLPSSGLPEPTCASPTNCATSRGVHLSPCAGSPRDGGVDTAGSVTPEGGVAPIDGGPLAPSTPDEGGGVPPFSGDGVIDDGGTEGEGAVAATDDNAAVDGGCGCRVGVASPLETWWPVGGCVAFALCVSARRRRPVRRSARR